MVNSTTRTVGTIINASLANTVQVIPGASGVNLRYNCDTPLLIARTDGALISVTKTAAEIVDDWKSD
jgi:hypothetical protein